MPHPNIVAWHSNYSQESQPEPEPEMGATQYTLNDRYPYTITEVRSNREIVVQPDSTHADPSKENEMGHQNWIIERNPQAKKKTLTLRNDGKWREKGVSKREAGTFWLIGLRDHYHCWEI